MLGTIPVAKNLIKSRYDYVFLQWWLHNKAQYLINGTLEYSYGSEIHTSDLGIPLPFPMGHDKHSLAEYLQIFILVYNVGHFYPTFVSSRAMLLKLQKSRQNREDFVNLFQGDAKTLCNRIIDTNDYFHFHLLNSLLVLEKCDQTLFSVQMAEHMILLYMKPDVSKKMCYLFGLFRKIRNFAISVFDLRIAKVPFRINLRDDASLKCFLEEYLAYYNDNSKADHIILSLTKLLSDTLYNENAAAIKEYGRVRKIANAIDTNRIADYYNRYFMDCNSVLNTPPKHSISIDPICMKLTFEADEQQYADLLFKKLQKMQHVRSSIYNRHYGQLTIIISTSKKKSADSVVFLRIYRTVLSILRSIEGIRNNDIRYLIATKYYLRSVFEDRRMAINANSELSQDCVFCVRGSNNRKIVINNHLTNYQPGADKHEVEHLRSMLDGDNKNDTSILIPASILLYSRTQGLSEIELDGLIIYPYRTSDQIVFLEAKETKEAGNARKCLKKKLQKMHIDIDWDKMFYTIPDAHYYHTV